MELPTNQTSQNEFFRQPECTAFAAFLLQSIVAEAEAVRTAVANLT